MPQLRTKQFFPDQTITNEVLEFRGDLIAFLTPHYPVNPYYILTGNLLIGLEQPPADNDTTHPTNIVFQDMVLQPGAIVRANFTRAYFRFLPGFSITQTGFTLSLNRSLSTPLRILFSNGLGLPCIGGNKYFFAAYSGSAPTSAGECTIDAPGNTSSKNFDVFIETENLVNALAYEVRAFNSSTGALFTVAAGALTPSASAQQIIISFNGVMAPRSQVYLSGGGVGETGVISVGFHYEGGV